MKMFIFRKYLRSSKVYNFDNRIFFLSLIKNIFRFKVTMNNLFRMAIKDSGENLFHNFNSLFLIVKERLLNNAIKQFPSDKQLSNNIEVKSVLIELEDSDNMRMVLSL